MSFLARLRRELRGPFTVVWDRSKIHSRSKVVKAWLARHPEAGGLAISFDVVAIQGGRLRRVAEAF